MSDSIEKTTTINHLDTACKNLVDHRKKPLLVLFYPPNAQMSEDDIEDVYDALRAEKLTPEERLDALDVLIESYGGSPIAGYRLAQIIRDFSREVFFLVPDHAFSAATLLVFSGTQVRLAHTAGLSPIDITFVSEIPGKKPRKEVELATIDSFIDFSVGVREKIEELLERLGRDASATNVDSDLLVEMVKQVGALQAGKFFRERMLTGSYAQQLLMSYMFAGALDANDRTRRVIKNFLHQAPAHDFHCDYHLCQTWGLNVVEMSTQESDLAKGVTTTLDELTAAGVICPKMSGQRRVPFFKVYLYTPSPQNVVSEAAGTEAANDAQEQQP